MTPTGIFVPVRVSIHGGQSRIEEVGNPSLLSSIFPLLTPSCHLPSLPLISSPPLPLEVGPLNPAISLVERCAPTKI